MHPLSTLLGEPRLFLLPLGLMQPKNGGRDLRSFSELCQSIPHAPVIAVGVGCRGGGLWLR